MHGLIAKRFRKNATPFEKQVHTLSRASSSRRILLLLIAGVLVISFGYVGFVKKGLFPTKAQVSSYWVQRYNIDGSPRCRNRAICPQFHGSLIAPHPDGGFITVDKIIYRVNLSGSDFYPNDLVLKKIRPDGTVEWDRRFESGLLGLPGFNPDTTFNPNSIDRTSDGAYIVVGTIVNVPVPTPNRTFVWLLKFDGNGTVIWEQRYDHVGFAGEVFDIKDVVPTSDGGYIVVGSRDFQLGFRGWDSVIMKFNNLGSFLWLRQASPFPGGDYNRDYLNKVFPLSGGRYRAFGNMEGGIEFDSKMFSVEFDDSGTILNTDFLMTGFGTGFSNNDALADAVKTADGGYATVSITLTVSGFQITIAKWRSDAQTIDWQVAYPYLDVGTFNLAQTSDGGYIITGSTGLGATDSKVIILKLNSSGAKLWSNQYIPGIAGTGLRNNDLIPTSDGMVLIGVQYATAENYREFPVIMHLDSLGRVGGSVCSWHSPLVFDSIPVGAPVQTTFSQPYEPLISSMTENAVRLISRAINVNPESICSGTGGPTTGTITKTGSASVRAMNINGSLSGQISYSITGTINSTAGSPITIEDTIPTDTLYVLGSGLLNGSPSDGLTGGACPVGKRCWTFTPPVGSSAYTLTFLVDVRPANYGSCGDITNSARLLEGSSELGVAVLDTDSGNPGDQPTRTECFELDKEVTKDLTNTSGWTDSLLGVNGVDPGHELLFRLSYKASGTASPFPTWTIVDTPESGRYDTGYLGDLGRLRPRIDAPIGNPTCTTPPCIVFTNSPNPPPNVSGTSPITFSNLPTGSHTITFFMKVSDTACPASPATANNRVALTIGGSGGSPITVSTTLHCRIVVTGDVGAGSSNITVNTFKVTGPAVIATGGNVSAPVPENINPNVRQLSNYTLSTTAWLDQFRRIRKRLLLEFARTNTSSSTWLRDGGNWDLSANNALGVWKYDINAGGGAPNLRCIGGAGNCQARQTNQFNFTSNPSIKSATILVTRSPGGNPNVKIRGNLEAPADRPVAILFDETIDSIEIIDTGNITFRHIALIAPESEIDFSASSPRSITFDGLVIANNVEGFDDPDNFGRITFDKLFVDKPPPGMAQLLSPLVGERAP